jgi:primosomal protein N' (replication factor Y)
MVCLLFKGPSEDRLQFFAAAASDALRKALGEGVTVSDPAPAPLARAKGLFRYHVLMRSPLPGRMVRAIVQLQRTMRLPDDVAMSVDVDPVNML